MRQIDLPDYNRAGFASAYGPWAIICGASEGTGACYAEQLAAMGINLVLVSRRRAALEELGARLATAHGISFRTIALDLKSEAAGETLVNATAELDIGLYISNAGTDGAGNSFLGSPLQRSRDVLTMNARTVIDAVHGFGNRFKKRGKGGIILMSSGAGLGGQPWLAMYSGTKAFEINFAESLWAEFEADNIHILAVAAPTMDTPSLRRAIEGKSFDISDAHNPADVAHIALATLGKDALYVFPDGPNLHKIPQLAADRRERLIALAEWAKGYTEGAEG